MHSLGVVIPMFNEEAGAERCVDAVLPSLDGLGREARLSIVDDGSSDRTPAILEQLASNRDRLVVEAHDAEPRVRGSASHWRRGGVPVGPRLGALHGQRPDEPTGRHRPLRRADRRAR